MHSPCSAIIGYIFFGDDSEWSLSWGCLTRHVNRSKSQRDEIREAAGNDQAFHLMHNAGHLVSFDPTMSEKLLIIF